MTDYYFTFRSITTAQRAQRICNEAAIGSYLLRTPKQLAKQGCGYSLKIPADQARKAVGLLRQANIAFQRIYQNVPASPTEVIL